MKVNRYNDMLSEKLLVSDKDAENPKYLFNGVNTTVLVTILKGDVDVLELVKKELANRGLDEKGKWVGFDNAANIHKTK